MTHASNNTCTHEHEPPPGGFETQEAESALEELRPTLLAIPGPEVRQFKVGVTTAVGIGLAYADALAEDRPLFEQAFRPEGFDPADYDDLELRAKAFWQADILMRQEYGADGPLRQYLAEAKTLKVKLLKGATYLWEEDAELGEVLADIRQGRGYADLADDLGAMAGMFADYWDQAESQCGVSLEDIDRAKWLGAEILQLLSPSKSEDHDDVRSVRNRAAEYLRRGIDDVRTAALFLFHKDRAMLERYPSLFVRKRSKSSTEEVSAESDSSSAANEPASSPTEGEPSPDSGDQPSDQDAASAQP